MKNHFRVLLSAGMFSLGLAPSLRAEYTVTAPPAELKLPGFYKKHVRAAGFPVVASEKVNDYALKEAAYLIERLLAQRPQVIQVMAEGGSHLAIMAHDEFTTDVPEHAHLAPKDHWDRRARGLGGSQTDPVCSCGEENLLAYPGDPYAAENILIHEFAHHVHLRGMAKTNPTFDERVKQAYQSAMKKGLWKKTYASTNAHEYFAEGVQSYFNNNRSNDNEHNDIDTRAELLQYDPDLAALCKEAFGDPDFVYTKPQTRLNGHLAGYDPAQAPAFRWPERLAAADRAIRKNVEQRNAAAEAPDIRHREQNVEGWQIFVDDRLIEGPEAETGKQALRILADRLNAIALIVPEGPLAELRKVSIYFDLNHPLKNLQYHPSSQWLKDNGHSPAMARCVHSPNAEHFIDLYKNHRQPWAMLHELAHAYHDQVLGFENAEIRAAYDRVKASGALEKVRHIRGHENKHYALTNPKEFFAEMTECYFGTNDFFPFVAGELKASDPETFQLLEKIWGKLR